MHITHADLCQHATQGRKFEVTSRKRALPSGQRYGAIFVITLMYRELQMSQLAGFLKNEVIRALQFKTG